MLCVDASRERAAFIFICVLSIVGEQRDKSQVCQNQTVTCERRYAIQCPVSSGSNNAVSESALTHWHVSALAVRLSAPPPSSRPRPLRQRAAPSAARHRTSVPASAYVHRTVRRRALRESV